MTINWDSVETVTVPTGAYISWGNKRGQHVTGKVIDYQPEGGSDYNGDPCPHITIELTEDAASINKEGQRTDYPAGEIVQLNVGQVSLKRKLRAGEPGSGDIIKITLDNLAKTDRGTVKEFDVKIARGAANSNGTKARKAAAKTAVEDDDEPPF